MGKDLIPALLNRGNDLDGFFWPVYYFVKQQVLLNHSLPYWNNLFLAGTPLLADPQSPLFYPLNIIFLFFPIDSAFLISFILHFFIGGVGMYLCSKRGFGFTKITSVFLALLYIFTPKFMGYVEAGHVGLINSIAWIPFALWASLSLRKNPKLTYLIIFGVSLALIYYCHLPTFMIISLTFGLLALKKKTISYLVLSVVIVFGLTAISILPQVNWQKYSTRYLLLENKDVYPKWTSVFEPIKNIFIPWHNGISSLQKINTEKWLALGLISPIIAFWGFLKLKTRAKIFFVCVSFFLFLILYNNASPVYPILLKQDWYLLLRVSTRFWILIILSVIYLSGLAIEKTRSKFLYLIIFLAILESAAIGWSYLNKPVVKNTATAPKEIYEYLSQDKSLYRIFCLNRCLTQKEASIYNFQLLDGYNTIQQRNFYQEAWQLTGTYWNYYTLSIPPLGTFVEKLAPDVKALGRYNVKYIISPYPLTDKNLIQKKVIGSYFIYENKSWSPRAFFISDQKSIEAPVTVYQPNFISIDIPQIVDAQIILSEVYSPGWKAYLNGKEPAAVQETPDALRAVDIGPDTKFVEFRYEPTGFRTGKFISIATVFTIFCLGILIGKDISSKTAFSDSKKILPRKI